LKKTERAIKNAQCRETGKTRHTRHRMKTKKNIFSVFSVCVCVLFFFFKQKTNKKPHTQKTKIMSKTEQTKNRGWSQVLGESKQWCRLRTNHVRSDYNLNVLCHNELTQKIPYMYIYYTDNSNTGGHFSFWIFNSLNSLHYSENY